MNVKTIFGILSGIWTIDFIITIILLNFYKGMLEGNLIARFFFDMGFWGFFMFFWIVMVLLALFSFFIKWMSNLKYNKLPKLTEKIGILIFLMGEGYTIINNIKLLCLN